MTLEETALAQENREDLIAAYLYAYKADRVCGTCGDNRPDRLDFIYAGSFFKPDPAKSLKDIKKELDSVAVLCETCHQLPRPAVKLNVSKILNSLDYSDWYINEFSEAMPLEEAEELEILKTVPRTRPRDPLWVK